MRAIVVLFNRDLRVHDHPALAEAVRRAERVVPLFVLDDAILGSRYASANRVGFLLEALEDLRGSLRERGGDLVVRRGDPVQQAMALVAETGVEAVHVSADVSALAHRREQGLVDACASQRIDCVLFPGVMVAAPEQVRTGSGQSFRVFTSYWRAWTGVPRRALESAPQSVRLPDGVEPGPIPAVGYLVSGERSPEVAPGGESAGRARLNSWVGASLSGYSEGHDDLAADATSRVSPYLHFGCVSPLELVTKLAGRPGAESFVRQVCWRDFHYQFTAAFPAITTTEYRSRGDDWRQDEGDFEAWAQGPTGYPIVDAGMRQLRQEGWMHNRARLITASFLVKDLYLDWRRGEQHSFDWLLDGDIANNAANWQWVAGTGADTRPYRVFNPLRQAERFDPDGDYVRRYVPELAGVEGKAVHQPWTLEPGRRALLDYPDPIVDHTQAAAAYRDRHR